VALPVATGLASVRARGTLGATNLSAAAVRCLAAVASLALGATNLSAAAVSCLAAVPVLPVAVVAVAVRCLAAVASLALGVGMGTRVTWSVASRSRDARQSGSCSWPAAAG